MGGGEDTPAHNSETISLQYFTPSRAPPRLEFPSPRTFLHCKGSLSFFRAAEARRLMVYFFGKELVMRKLWIRSLGMAVVFALLAGAAQAAPAGNALFSPLAVSSGYAKALNSDESYRVLAESPSTAALELVRANAAVVNEKAASVTLNLGAGLDLRVHRVDAYRTESGSRRRTGGSGLCWRVSGPVGEPRWSSSSRRPSSPGTGRDSGSGGPGRVDADSADRRRPPTCAA